MSERIKWTDYDGFIILSVDYSDLPESEYLETMEEVEQLLKALQGEPSDSAMLIMANVTNTRATKKIRNRGKEVSAVLDAFKGHAYAVIGVTGVARLLARKFTSGIYFAHTEHDARRWLVAQAKQIAKQ
jgi:hypothetical protein